MNLCNKSLVPVEKREVSSSKTQPSVSSENVAPVIISWPDYLAPKISSYCPKPKGPRIIPVIPVKSRNDSALTVGVAQQFSSTTFLNGARKVEPTTIHEPLSKHQPRGDHITLMEIPVETMVSDNNEIQTIQAGNFSNIRFVGQDDVIDSSTEETLIASRDSSGNCYVAVQKPNVDSQTKQDCACESCTPDPKIRYVPASKITFNTKRGIMRCGKSRMIADTHTTISAREFKRQLKDTSDTIGQMEIAPPTKYFMNTLNSKGVNKLFANPGRRMSVTLSKSYTRHLTMKQIQGQETFSDLALQPVEFTSNVDKSKTKLISQKCYPEATECQQKLLSERLTPEAELLQGLDKEMPTDDLTLVEDSSGNFSGGDVQELVMTLQAEKEAEPNQTIIMLRGGHNSNMGDLTMKNVEALLAAAEKYHTTRNNIRM